MGKKATPTKQKLVIPTPVLRGRLAGPRISSIIITEGLEIFHNNVEDAFSRAIDSPMEIETIKQMRMEEVNDPCAVIDDVLEDLKDERKKNEDQKEESELDTEDIREEQLKNIATSNEDHKEESELEKKVVREEQPKNNATSSSSPDSDTLDLTSLNLHMRFTRSKNKAGNTPPENGVSGKEKRSKILAKKKVSFSKKKVSPCKKKASPKKKIRSKEAKENADNGGGRSTTFRSGLKTMIELFGDLERGALHR